MTLKDTIIVKDKRLTPGVNSASNGSSTLRQGHQEVSQNIIDPY